MELGTEVGTDVSCNTRETSASRGTGGTAKKSRSWFLTLNNYSREDIVKLEGLKYKYLLYQFERGEEGTDHLHAYIYYENAVVMPKRYIPEGHWESVVNQAACMKYCSKKETRVGGPFERGTKPEQGRRTDLEELAREFVNKPEAEFATENPDTFVRYNRGLKEYKRAVTMKHRTCAPTIYWRWGKSGCGKTRGAVEAHPDSYYIKDGSRWWDGYEQQEAIIIDDFEARDWEWRSFLRLLDRYQYQGQVKGSYVPINSPFLYITCEFPPEHFWDGNCLEQVMRRIRESGGEVINVDGCGYEKPCILD